MDKIKELLENILDDNLLQIMVSGKKSNVVINKIKLKPLLIKNEIQFQAAEYTDKQVFHKNLNREQAVFYILEKMEMDYKQMQVETTKTLHSVLVSKKGKCTIKSKRLEQPAGKADFSHNRKKNYILKEGVKVDFLMDLGVMSKEGKIIHARYDKYKQINRFLEFVEDILPELDVSKQINIIDFGCGRSYLTFAIYYFLKELNGLNVRMTGLDLKEDVIEECNRLRDKYGYDQLEFIKGDIADYHNTDEVDMVVTLHACDTATDYALEKAVKWNAKVILSVPCCQHEVNKQIKNELLAPILQYGILKERISALITDGIRAQLLESCGYKTQILEFIDMDHTPKNLLIRAVRTNKSQRKEQSGNLEKLMEELHISPTLEKLLKKK